MKRCTLTVKPKKKYRTEKEAGRAMLHLWHDNDVNIYDLHTYLCSCGYWHVGSRSKYERRLERENEKRIQSLGD